MKELELYSLLTPTVTSLGCELWGVEFFPQGKHSLLRLFIDKPMGITLDELGELSQHVNAVLDVEDPIKGEYKLEVSSPGINRQLFFPEQFCRYIGHTVAVRLKAGDQRNFKGVLHAADTDGISLLLDGQQLTFAMENIEKANVMGEIGHG